jgi:hypothetical protein
MGRRPAGWIGGDFGWPPDGEPEPGAYGWTAGAAAPAAGPDCRGCGRPVEWRHLRWAPRTVVEDGGRRARVLVEPGEPWHPGCEFRARRQALRAALADARAVGGIVGRSTREFVGGVGAALVAAGRGHLEAGVPPLVEQGRLVVEAARPLVGVVGREARRRVRRVRLDRPARVVGWVVGVGVDAGARVGWRLDLARSRVVQAVGEWRRGVGYTRAWRVALDGQQSPAVVALRGWAHAAGAGVGEGVRPAGLRWDIDGVDPAAGQAGPAGGWVSDRDLRGALAEVDATFRRAYLDGWWTARGPRGHGDVDTSREQDERRGDGPRPNDRR